MKLTKILSLLAATLVLGTAAACASGSNNAANTVAGSDSLQNSSASPSTPQATETKTNQLAQSTGTTTESQRPSTKTDTISVEGEKTEVTLKLYDQASEAFTTYYPENDFVAESGGSGEGTGARFYFNAGGTKNENVYVAMFFPNQANNLEQIQKLVTGKGGLVQSNQWQVVSRTKDVPYAWAKEKIVFKQRTGSENIGGAVYIGKSNGKVFYVITHYPAEYGDGFAPRASLILKNLQVSD
jgi:hypothetical protein